MLVAFVSIMHIVWGVALYAHGSPVLTTGTSVLRDIVGAGHYDLRACVYVLSGLLPLVVLWRPASVVGLLSLLPQQTLLVFSGIGAVVAISSGHFADGVPRGAAFLVMDQGVYVLLAVLHAFESLDRYHDRLRERRLHIYFMKDRDKEKEANTP